VWLVTCHAKVLGSNLGGAGRTPLTAVRGVRAEFESWKDRLCLLCSTRASHSEEQGMVSGELCMPGLC